MMHPFMDPTRFTIELAYTLIAVILCFLIYFKTKEIYDLTKHKGISYFRKTFLFFGMAYITRFVFHFLKISNIWLDLYIPRRTMGPIFMLFTAYFSTMALLCLIYSTTWKRFSSKEFMIAANILAVLIALAAAISPPLFLITQAVLLIIAIALSLIVRKKTGIPKTTLLYFLVFAFWIISLILIIPGRVLGFEIRIALELISVVLFGIIYYKVSKWTK